MTRIVSGLQIVVFVTAFVACSSKAVTGMYVGPGNDNYIELRADGTYTYSKFTGMKPLTGNYEVSGNTLILKSDKANDPVPSRITLEGDAFTFNDERFVKR